MNILEMLVLNSIPAKLVGAVGFEPTTLRV